MISQGEKLTATISRIDFASLRSAWVMRCRAENDRLEKVRRELEVLFEQVDVPHDAKLTADGREIMRGPLGKAWALRPEIHAERLAAAFEAAKKQQAESETKSVVGTESLSNVTCPKCGDTLQHTAVCPKCAAGKLGYRHRYTCACGGADLISREAL